MDTDNDLRNRFKELYEKAYSSDSFCFTAFLGLNEISVLKSMTDAGIIPCNYVSLYGGACMAERMIARFGDPSEFGWEEPFPVIIIKIEPLIEKFSDELTHRDFLGALMNLGIERDTVGDIIVSGHSAYIIAEEKIAGFITENLDSVKHTHVKCTACNEMPADLSSSFDESEITAASLRADAVVAELVKISRSKALELFREKKIFINGPETENNSMQLKTGDNISIRGTGRFIFSEILYTTKKGNFCLKIRKYI